MEVPASLSTGRGEFPPPKWFLSFDPATKSFAWSLLRVWEPPPGFAARLADPRADPAWARRAVRRLATGFHLAAGGTADLVPGVDNRKIPTVRRTRALKKYLREVVLPALAAAEGCPGPDDPALNVIVEFQMGANAKSRIVAHDLVYAFAGANVFHLDAHLKNRVRFADRRDLDHCMFLERYSSSYNANKAHAAAAYFDHLAPLFRHPTLPTVKHKKDFADTVMQVLGYLYFGDRAAPEKLF